MAGVCWLVMGLCVPFYVAVLYAILGVWGLAALISASAFSGGVVRALCCWGGDPCAAADLQFCRVLD